MIVLTCIVCAHAVANLIKVHREISFQEVDCEGSREAWMLRYAALGLGGFPGETLPCRAGGSVGRGAKITNECCSENHFFVEVSGCGKPARVKR
jgi:hypothetical protein